MEKNIDFTPYKYGIYSGILLVLSVWFSGHFFGASTTYVKDAGFIKEALSPIVEGENIVIVEYFTKNAPSIDWQWMFVVGVMIGAFISSKSDNSFKIEKLPKMWKDRFGASLKKRFVYSFIGGIIAMFGARMAGGCPSGHGLSGLSQFSMSGFVALAAFFTSGVIVANILYRSKK